MPVQRIILTDTDSGEVLKTGHVDASSGVSLSGSADWSISKRTLSGGPSDGVDVVDLNNGELSMSILPTRGMGLWRGSYHGIPIGWNSPVARPVHPSLVNLEARGGLGWLGGFNERQASTESSTKTETPPNPNSLSTEKSPISRHITFRSRFLTRGQELSVSRESSRKR
jgi:hypothetical protein